jgi:hypothetical protein
MAANTDVVIAPDNDIIVVSRVDKKEVESVIPGLVRVDKPRKIDECRARGPEFMRRSLFKCADVWLTMPRESSLLTGRWDAR